MTIRNFVIIEKQNFLNTNITYVQILYVHNTKSIQIPYVCDLREI